MACSGSEQNAAFPVEARVVRTPSAQIKFDINYTIGYTIDMKTAISIEDDIFSEAETTAKEMGLSRSKFYSKAILEFIQNHKYDAITEKYNKIYKKLTTEKDIEIEQANFDLFNKEEW